MSSKAKTAGGGKGIDGDGGDGGRDKKKKKKGDQDKGDKCKKCKTLFPIMYKMKDLLSTLQPQCNQYRLELDAVKAENEKLRRRLGLPPASATAPTPPAAAPTASSAAGASSSRRSTKTPSSARAQTTTTKKLLPASGGISLDNGGIGGHFRGDGGGGRNGGNGPAGAPGTVSAAEAEATPRKGRSKGEKIRDWTAAVARNKRGRSNGSPGGTAPHCVGGGSGGDGVGGVSGDSVAGAGNTGGNGYSDSEDEQNGSAEGEPAQETGSAEVGRGAGRRSGGVGGGVGGGSGDGGSRKKGKGMKEKKQKKKEAALKPAGVFAAAEFSFLDDGEENEEEQEEDVESESDGGSQGRRRKPRKRARTTSRTGPAASKGGRSVGANGGPVPRTSSMLARGFHARGEVDVNGWGEGEEAQEVEWYEDSPNEMEDLGWSQFWRRGDAVSVGGSKGGEGDEGESESDGVYGDGLDERSRALAQKSLKLIHDASVSEEGSGELVGPKGLSKLLRLELTGAVTMDGVLMAVLRGRSLARDAGFLARLVLRVVEGIDGAHVSPITDPGVLTLVVEELEGLAELVAAPSAPEARGIGWGRETRLAVEFLTKTLLEGLEQARGAGDGGEEEDASGGYSSMSFGNSRKKKKKIKANNSNGGEGDRDGPGNEKGSGWRAEAEAPVLWWWETDEAARVPWGVARLLGLLLRRLRKPEHTRSILHSILVRCAGGPVRLLRFPLAFLEAFPGYFLPPHPPAPSAAAAAAASSSPAHGSSNGAESGSEAVVVAGSEAREGGVLAPGLWGRAVRAVMFSQGGDGGGGGNVGAAVVANRFKLVCLGEGVGSGGGSIDGKGGLAGKAVGGEAPAKLTEEILQVIGALHQPQEGSGFGEDGQGCALCCGVGGGGGACGGDDALAMSSGISVAVGGMEDLSGELGTPRSQEELLAVEALRALRLLSEATEIGGLTVGRRLERVVRRAGACQRAAALACHALAQCAGSGRSVGLGVGVGGGGGGVRPRAGMMDMSVTKTIRVLKMALESDPRKWEVGQVEEGFRLSHGAKAHAASALLALLEGRHGEVAAETERSIIEWTQKLEPKDRLSTPLPLLLSVTGLLSRPPAHVINLTRRPYRWKAVSDVARREGVLLHRHVAVDASSSGIEKGFISEKEVATTWATELNTMHDKDYQKETTLDMHPSERACAASHLGLWKRHKLGKLAPFMPEVHPDAVLILEDDAQLKPGFLERAKATILQATTMDRDPKTKQVGLRKKWDILYLGHILPFPIITAIWKKSLKAKSGAEPNVTEPSRDPDRADGPNATPHQSATTPPAPAAATASAAEALGLQVAPVTFAWGLHAYLLTRDAAARLVDHLPVSAPADIFVGSFLAATDSGRPMLAGRAVLPALATTPGGAGAGAGGCGATGIGDAGDVVSTGTCRSGVAHGVWSKKLSGRSARFEGAGEGET
eukprot:g10541.t1